MDSLIRDLRYGWRALRNSPGFTAIALLTLMLGIGATTAVFSVVSALLLRPLPYAEGDRIVVLTEGSLVTAERGTTTSWANYLDWKRDAKSFEAMALFQQWQPALTGNGEPERLKAALVTSGVFDVLRVAPILGRTMEPRDNLPDSENVAIVSHGFWERRMSSDPSAVGRTLTLNAQSITVIGVLQAGFRGPGDLDAELWANHAPDPRDTRGSRHLTAIARLEPGVTLEEARAEMRGISTRLASEYPQSNAKMVALVTPLRETLVGEVATPLFMLLGAAGLVLLLACANLTNLLLSRGIARQREFTIRAAIGSSRAMLVRQLLTEGLLLAAIGGALGVMAAVWATQGLIALGPETIRSQPIGLDLRVLAFAVVATLATGLVLGSVPALKSGRVNLHDVLRAGGRGGSMEGTRARSALLVVQLGVALALLTGTGLLLKSLARLQQVDSGIRADHVITAAVNLPGSRYPTEKQPLFFETVVAGVSRLPGVSAAAVSSIVPFGGDWDRIALDIEGRPTRSGAEQPEADRYIVSADYFTVMGIGLRSGRLFGANDRAGLDPVVVVDEVLARRFWPGDSPLEHRVSLGFPDGPRLATVVGVVGHVKHYGLDQTSGGQIYLFHQQYPWRWMRIVARTDNEPAATAPLIREAVRAVDPDLPVYAAVTMDQLMTGRDATRRFTMILLAAFAGIALVVATIGLYGVMAYGVTQRRREIGIRAALGASPREILRLVLMQGGRLTLIGIGVGLAGALAASPLLGTLLFGVSPADPVVLLGVAALLAAASFVACYVPARRAASVDPTVVLRME